MFWLLLVVRPRSRVGLQEYRSRHLLLGLQSYRIAFHLPRRKVGGSLPPMRNVSWYSGRCFYAVHPRAVDARIYSRRTSS